MGYTIKSDSLLGIGAFSGGNKQLTKVIKERIHWVNCLSFWRIHRKFRYGTFTLETSLFLLTA